MQTNILWKGCEYLSLENCLIIPTKKGTAINSVIVGSYQEKIYRTEYSIRINPDWEVVFFSIKSQINGTQNHFSFESDGKGNWITDGKPAEEFNGCIDIDISLTPFTNTLPIQRLKLANGDARQIQVLYLDVLNREVKPVQQKYTRISPEKYRYENVPNDFEALIEVDEQGLVVDYPGLFVRKDKRLFSSG